MASILVIEDDVDSAVPLVIYLRRLGHQVEHAENGDVALRSLFSGHTPDVILLDLQMPVMDGLSFLDNLRSSRLLRDLPVIVISALFPVALQELAPYGVTASLTKGHVDYLKLGQYLQRFDFTTSIPAALLAEVESPQAEWQSQNRSLTFSP